MKTLFTVALIALIPLASLHAADNGKHLFILSGQSNMVGLDPQVSFTPAVEAAFGKDNVIVVHDAENGEPIRRWYKKWSGEAPHSKEKKRGTAGPVPNGDLHERLMAKVNTAIKNRQIKTVTFVWMQGETDATEGNDNIYKESLLGLVKQLSDDLKRNDVNYVIGRLSLYKKSKPSWEGVRKAQVEAAEASPRGAWVDTDDVDIKGIHYTEEGYKDLGKRFAEKAIALINKK
jgi:hypothetical protein